MGFSIFSKSKIKIGFLISYDYRYIYDALKLVYDYADEIILAIDENRNTWAGGKYEIEESFFDKIKSMDPKNKIVFFEDDFYVPTLTPMENDTRERNMLSKKMGPDCWKLQIDADEYFLNFPAVYEFLQKHRYFLSKPKYNPVNIRANWITLFKKTDTGFIYIDNDEDFSFATNLVGEHFFARDLASKTNREIYTNFRVLHQSWAREPEEIYRKINNWSHKDDFDGGAFYKFWMSVNETNYGQFTDLHPIYKGAWKSLKFIACTDIHDFIRKFNEIHPPLQPTKLPTKYFKKYVKSTLKFWRK
ncbi:MAG TPA: hypothetical protein VK528_02360 [Flavobacterium sp.]|nr:hypothetical protein [Flavobacterium sp.]